MRRGFGCVRVRQRGSDYFAEHVLRLHAFILVPSPGGSAGMLYSEHALLHCTNPAHYPPPAHQNKPARVRTNLCQFRELVENFSTLPRPCAASISCLLILRKTQFLRYYSVREPN